MVVSGSLERLRRYTSQDERQRKALDAIASSVERGATLTRQLLSFSRRQTLEPGTVALAQHFGQLEDMLRSSLRGDIDLQLRMDPELWPILVDVSEFELAILNIAVNARDAMPKGGQLTISAQNVSLPTPNTLGISGDFVSISFSDTGAGIPDDWCPACSSHSSQPKRWARNGSWIVASLWLHAAVRRHHDDRQPARDGHNAHALPAAVMSEGRGYRQPWGGALTRS
jgi:hypothetical protein